MCCGNTLQLVAAVFQLVSQKVDTCNMMNKCIQLQLQCRYALDIHWEHKQSEQPLNIQQMPRPAEPMTVWTKTELKEENKTNFLPMPKLHLLLTYFLCQRIIKIHTVIWLIATQAVALKIIDNSDDSKLMSTSRDILCTENEVSCWDLTMLSCWAVLWWRAS